MEHPLSDFGLGQERREKAVAGVRRMGSGSVKADARLREELAVDLMLPTEDFPGLEVGSEKVD